MGKRDVNEAVLRARWYLLGAPWVLSAQAGMTILAGHPDPHIGILVCDTELGGGDDDIEGEAVGVARAIAAHMVEVHNEWLDRSGVAVNRG